VVSEEMTRLGGAADVGNRVTAVYRYQNGIQAGKGEERQRLRLGLGRLLAKEERRRFFTAPHKARIITCSTSPSGEEDFCIEVREPSLASVVLLRAPALSESAALIRDTQKEIDQVLADIGERADRMTEKVQGWRKEFERVLDRIDRLTGE
jgi:hypothetical protein